MVKDGKRLQQERVGLRTAEELQVVTIGPVSKLQQPLVIDNYDETWPRQFGREVVRISQTLESRVLLLEHVGSTSVPGLAAKPIIDMLLVVADSAEETAYLADLEAVGYWLKIREPEWYEHRMLKGPDTDINLHVFSAACPEIDRMLCFRNWLRSNDEDRERYQQTKMELARQDWEFIQHYADAKTAVVEDIIARAMAAPIPE